MPSKEKPGTITMRVRVADAEMEVTGPSDYVERKIEEFLKRGPATGTASSQSAPRELAHAAVASSTSGTRAKSPAQFFKSVNPRTDVDRVLVAAFFLEKFRTAQSVTAGEVRELIKEAKWPPPANANEAINQNIRKGFLMTAGDRDGKMAFVVTSDGETQVDEMTTKPTT